MPIYCVVYTYFASSAPVSSRQADFQPQDQSCWFIGYEKLDPLNRMTTASNHNSPRDEVDLDVLRNQLRELATTGLRERIHELRGQILQQIDVLNRTLPPQIHSKGGSSGQCQSQAQNH